MSTPQSGIFALGTASHAYLEFDASGAGREHEFVAAISFLREPHDDGRRKSRNRVQA
jgi:porphyrinogen peroxidase